MAGQDKKTEYVLEEKDYAICLGELKHQYAKNDIILLLAKRNYIFSFVPLYMCVSIKDIVDVRKEYKIRVKLEIYIKFSNNKLLQMFMGLCFCVKLWTIANKRWSN